MGTTLLIGSCEPFSGKSALVLGIAQQLIQSGLPFRFGKPLAISLEWDPNKGPLPQPLIDDDVRFVGETLGMAADRLIPSLHLMSPTTATQRLGQGQLEAGEGFHQLSTEVAASDGLTLLECAGTLQEGLLFGLSLPQLAEGLEAKVVLVHLWQDSCSVDALLSAKQILGDRLVGVVLNAVTPDEVEFGTSSGSSADLGLTVFGDATVTAAQRHCRGTGEAPDARVICCADRRSWWRR